ncbi:MAG: TrbI/VirB10 family protein [Rickettsiales bacterium]|jgi:type IV secretory pathway VirB10-like protein|nr:TrbI/VirB10 family protein [Rickettsiales bacterium]
MPKEEKKQEKEEDLKDEEISVGHSKGSKTILLIGGAIGISVLFYILFFGDEASEGGQQDMGVIVKQDAGGEPAGGGKLNFNPVLNSLESVPTIDNQKDAKIQTVVPEMPELPVMSDKLRKQLANIMPQKEEDEKPKEETFTKEEVDAMIEERIRKTLQEQMQMINASNTKQVEETKNGKGDTTAGKGTDEDDDEDDSATESVAAKKDSEDDLDLDLGDDGATDKKKVPAKRKKGTSTTGEVDVTAEYNDDGTEKTDDEMMAEQAKLEEKELLKLAKERTMQERKQAPMFAIGGGEGGNGGEEADGEAVILTFVDGSKVSVQTKNPDVKPQQIQDLGTVIIQGKIVTAVLETAIDTSIQTTVRAVITKDVYAEEGKNVLIPKGSRIIGSYSASDITTGKLSINWSRIIRVDGMTLNISSIGTDRLGRAGVPGEVDNKYAQRIANSFLSSVLTVGTAIVGERISGSTGVETTLSSLTGDTTTTAGKASDFAIIDATKKLMSEAESIVGGMAKEQQPVIRIAQGQKITIMVMQDMSLPVFKRGI